MTWPQYRWFGKACPDAQESMPLPSDVRPLRLSLLRRSILRTLRTLRTLRSLRITITITIASVTLM